MKPIYRKITWFNYFSTDCPPPGGASEALRSKIYVHTRVSEGYIPLFWTINQKCFVAASFNAGPAADFYFNLKLFFLQFSLERFRKSEIP